MPSTALCIEKSLFNSDVDLRRHAKLMNIRPVKLCIAIASTLKSALLCTALVAAPFALAEDAPPSYEASPDVYKLVQENDQFRVIEATWKPNQKDAIHSHLPTVIYWISDCELNVDIPGGERIEGKQKAGTSRINPAVSGHVATNMGKDTCKALLVERK